MLQTLLKLGQQGGESRGVWDDILKFPAVETENKKGPIRNYCLPVRFDLDDNTVTLGTVQEYHEASGRELFNLAVAGGNNPSVYVCVDGRKNLGQFAKTFFGKAAGAERGELLNELHKVTELTGTLLAELLRRIHPLRAAFEQLALNEKGELTLKKLAEEKRLGVSEQVVLVYAEVKCADLGLADFTPLALMRDGELTGVAGYVDFVRSRYGATRAASGGTARLCYATGIAADDVGELDISERYSLNKMFVTTTLHYAPAFAKNDYQQQYQVSAAAQQLLERGSKKLLERYKTRIAGIDHCLVPRLLSTDDTAVESYLPRLSRKADLLFQYKKITEAEEELQLDSDMYWITFLGFESDGNFFKTINLIEDVSQTYFSQLVAACQQLDAAWRQAPELCWADVMGQLSFNFYTVYGLVPVRKDKEKRNAALLLFKQILERRPVRRAALFAHFREVILCHRYRRYGAYGNIYDNNQSGKLSTAQAFDYAARATVYQYLGLFQLLTQFNLFADMEPTPTTPELDAANAELEVESETAPPRPLSEYQQKIENFFTRTSYSDAQKALFYLGRALNVVAYEQYKKGYESKPVLAKLNYAGMDGRALMRLRNDLADKARQFNLHGLMEPLLGRFHGLFGSLEQWTMHPEEALFYVLSGYTFYTK
jgi:CRISPR-associated protein Csh1